MSRFAFVVACVVAMAITTAVFAAMFHKRMLGPPTPVRYSPIPEQFAMPKMDREPLKPPPALRVVPLGKSEPPASQPEPVKPAVPASNPPPAQASSTTMERDVCARSGGRKVVYRGGRSWRCAYAKRRR